MRQHILNCFEITNSASLGIEYRLIDVEGPFDPRLADEDGAERNLQQLLKRIAYTERIPVAVHSYGSRPVLSIPAAHSLSVTEYDLAPDVATLTPRNSTGQLRLGELNKETARIGMSFLAYHFRSPLFSDNRLWSSSPWVYYRKTPLNFKEDRREVDVYSGFGFRLGMRNGKLCLWVKLTHRYAESAWLLDAYSTHEITETLHMRHALYHYGNKWYPVQLLGLTGKSIADQRFIPEGQDCSTNVYEYTQREVGGKKCAQWIEFLDGKSAAIAYQYPGNKKKRYGAAALCKLLLRTEDPRVSRLHHFSIKDPERRFEESRRVVETFFQKVTLQGRPVVVSKEPVAVRRRCFSVPAQEFGQGQIIRVGGDSAAGDVRLSELGRKRWEMLLKREGGVAVSTALDAQYLLIPESLERGIAVDFEKRLEQTTKGILQRSFGFTRVLYADKDARTLKHQVDAILKGIEGAGISTGRGVLILPARAEPDLHNFVKRKLNNRMQLQCVSAGRVAEFYEVVGHNGQAAWSVRDELANRYISYLRYAAMGLLLVNRQWPWVLAQDTNYDMYIGLDVLERTAAFTFFSEGGRHCYIHSVESQQKEKLLRKQVRAVVYENLKRDLLEGRKRPRSIILRRDGRVFRCEALGFKDAILELIKEKLLDADVVYGVIEVHKNTAEGSRLVEMLDDGALRNPQIGAWEPLADQAGIVCTTGYPFRFRGTVKPLYVRVVMGELDLEKILEDTFWMSQLCWPVPDRCIRLSVDLKLCDDYLRSIAGDADDDEGMFGAEDDDDGIEPDEHVSAGWSA